LKATFPPKAQILLVLWAVTDTAFDILHSAADAAPTPAAGREAIDIDDFRVICNTLFISVIVDGTLS
jgi:hypothetical protein